MSRGRGSNTQVAASTPFVDDNVTYTASDVQEALEKTITASGASRLPVVFAYAGTASNRWLQLFDSIPSDQVPFVMSEAGTIKTLAIATNGTSTVTVTIYKNGVLLDTISTAGTAVNTKIVTHSLTVNDELSAKVTAGSASKPIFYATIQVTA